MFYKILSCVWFIASKVYHGSINIQKNSKKLMKELPNASRNKKKNKIMNRLKAYNDITR